MELLIVIFCILIGATFNEQILKSSTADTLSSVTNALRDLITRMVRYRFVAFSKRNKLGETFIDISYKMADYASHMM